MTLTWFWPHCSIHSALVVAFWFWKWQKEKKLWLLPIKIVQNLMSTITLEWPLVGFYLYGTKWISGQMATTHFVAQRKQILYWLRARNRFKFKGKCCNWFETNLLFLYVVSCPYLDFQPEKLISTMANVLPKTNYELHAFWMAVNARRHNGSLCSCFCFPLFSAACSAHKVNGTKIQKTKN